MERAQKERLVGAVVLVSVAWLLIPVFLDQSADGPGETVERRISLPDADEIAEEDSGRRRQTVQLNQPEASEPVPTPVITELPAPSRPTSQDTPETDVVDNAVAENVEALESSSAPEGGDTSTAASATARDSVAETDTTPPPEVTPASSADTETNTDTARDTNAAAETQSEPPATIEPAPEVEAPVRDAPPTGAASGQLWAVQLGSFGDPANAQRLAASVREYGMIAFVSEVESNGRTMHRVRIGPQASRAESDAIVNRLRDEGTDARVVAYP